MARVLIPDSRPLEQAAIPALGLETLQDYQLGCRLRLNASDSGLGGGVVFIGISRYEKISRCEGPSLPGADPPINPVSFNV